MILALSILAVLAGSALLAVGLRGRRTDDHPLCRRCGYDLTGRSADTTRCGECGADLSRPGAIRVGHRARRRRPQWAGAVAVLLGLSVGGVDVAVRVMHVQWIHYEPLAWLLRDAAPGQPNQPAALGELTRRLAARALSTAATATVVDRALDAQADRTRPWAKGWIELLTTAVSDGQLTADELRRYAEQAIQVELHCKPILRRGRYEIVRFEEYHNRLLAEDELHGSFGGRGLYLDADPRDLGGLHLGDFQNPGPLGQSTTVAGVTWPDDFQADRSPGPHILHVDVQFDVSLRGRTNAGPFHFTKRAACPVTVADHDAVTDAFVVRPDDRAAEIAAVRQVLLRIADDRAWGRTGVAAVEVRLASPPVAIAADVVVIQGGHEQCVGQVCTGNAHSDTWYEAFADDPPRFTSGTVDVALRPSQDAADRELAVVPYWGEPIVLHDVPAIAPPTAAFIVDPKLRPAMSAAMTIGPITRAGSELRVDVEAGCREPCVPLPTVTNFNVVLRAGGRETAYREAIQFNKGTSHNSWEVTIADPAPGARKVDVILRPRPLHGQRPADQGLPWGEEMVFHDVAVPP